jgi:hypothetical protein
MSTPSTIPCTASQTLRGLQGGLGPLFGGTDGVSGLDGASVLQKTLQGSAAIAAGSSGPSHFLPGSLGSLDLAAGLLQLAAITITSAELLALNSTPVQLIAAPGAGKSISLAGPILFRFNWNSIQYTGGGAISIIYAGGATNLMASTVPASFVDAPTGPVTNDNLVQPLSTILTVPQATAVQLTCATGNFVAGNSTLTIWVPYVIH